MHPMSIINVIASLLSTCIQYTLSELHNTPIRPPLLNRGLWEMQFCILLQVQRIKLIFTSSLVFF